MAPGQNLLRSGNQFFECGDEYLADYKDKQSSDLPLGACYPFAAFAYSGLRSLNVPALTAIEPVHAHPLDHALDFQNEHRSKLILQWIANNRTQSALAHQDNDPVAVKKYDYALGRITTFFEQVCGLEMEFRLKREPLEVVLKVNGEQVPLNVLPDGVKSMLSWIGDLVQRMDAIPWCQRSDIFSQPIFLFLDEVDIHLHPKWQRLILPAVQRLFTGAEVFVSTHSPFVVGSVEDAWVYRLPEANSSSLVQAEDSGAGKSYSVVLREIFSVDEEFDPQTEALFERFYAARNRALATQGMELDDLLSRPVCSSCAGLRPGISLLESCAKYRKGRAGKFAQAEPTALANVSRREW